MIIKVERSGGLTGIPIYNEIDVNDLPSALLNTVKKIMVSKKRSSPMKVAPRGAADHYSYRISIHDGVNQNVIECNQYNIEDDLKLLVKYIEKNSKKRFQRIR